MATFTYEAMNQAGQEVKDELEALSSEDALSKIRNLGYFPTRIREKGTNRSRFFRGQVDKYTWVAEGSSYVLSDVLAEPPAAHGVQNSVGHDPRSAVPVH